MEEKVLSDLSLTLARETPILILSGGNMSLACIKGSKNKRKVRGNAHAATLFQPVLTLAREPVFRVNIVARILAKCAGTTNHHAILVGSVC